MLALAAGWTCLAQPADAGRFSLRAMFPGEKLSFTRQPAPVVALTFDDGPDAEYTLPIAEMLHSRGAGATFFLIGKHIAEHPQVARRLAGFGFELGNHSYDHPDMARLAQSQIEWQLDETNRLLTEVAGARATFFRPPYGSLDARVLAAVQARGMMSVLWNVDSRDWATADASEVSARVMATARPGAVILLHSTHPQTLAALPAILDGLAAKGYRVESVSGWLAAMQGLARPQLPPPPPRIVEGPVMPPAGLIGEEIPVATMGANPKEMPTAQTAPAAKSGFRIITNIGSLEALYRNFLEGLLVPRSRPSALQRLPRIAWQRELPARSPELYDRGFLLNNHVYAANYYPQPRFFLLLKWEQMADADAELLQRLVRQGGVCYTLIVSAAPEPVLVGEFGLPARVIAPRDYDGSAVFVLGRDSLADLVDLLRRKKAAIFVSVQASAGDAELAEEFASGLLDFMTFRQLTNDRVFDPARDLRESLHLPQGVELARFSGSGRTMLMLLAQDEVELRVPSRLRGFLRISLQPDAVAMAEPVGRMLTLPAGATYLLSP